MRHLLALPILVVAVACNGSLPDSPAEITPDAAATAQGSGGGSGGSGSTGDTYVSNVTVSLTFDDTFADQYQAGAMLAARGMRGTFYINSPRINTTGFMTMAQIQSLAQDGNEIAGHTLDHEHLTTLTPDDARREICNDRAALMAMGFQVTSFAYPFGDNDLAVDQIACDCGYNSARDVGGIAAATCASCPYADTTPPAELYSLRTPASFVTTTTLEIMESYVLQAEAHGGGWVPLVIHHVCDGCNNTIAVSPALFEEYLDWLEAHGVPTKTVHEMIAGDMKAAITVP